MLAGQRLQHGPRCTLQPEAVSARGVRRGPSAASEATRQEDWVGVGAKHSLKGQIFEPRCRRESAAALCGRRRGAAARAASAFTHQLQGNLGLPSPAADTTRLP